MLFRSAFLGLDHNENLPHNDGFFLDKMDFPAYSYGPFDVFQLEGAGSGKLDQYSLYRGGHRDLPWNRVVMRCLERAC